MSEEELNRIADLVADKLGAGVKKNADKLLKRVPVWAWWALGVVAAAVVAYVAWSFWSVMFGSAVEAAQDAENKHNRIQLIIWATIISGGIMWLIFPFLAITLDRFTVRRQFMEKVRDGTASDVAMAVYSLGTGYIAATIFSAVMDALSGG